MAMTTIAVSRRRALAGAGGLLMAVVLPRARARAAPAGGVVAVKIPAPPASLDMGDAPVWRIAT
ncbi:MAG: hypothetical protein ABF821_05295, partial [Gluconacetobacter sp.]